MPVLLDFIRCAALGLYFYEQVKADHSYEQVRASAADCMQVLDGAAHAAQRCDNLRLIAIDPAGLHVHSVYHALELFDLLRAQLLDHSIFICFRFFAQLCL